MNATNEQRLKAAGRAASVAMGKRSWGSGSHADKRDKASRKARRAEKGRWARGEYE